MQGTRSSSNKKKGNAGTGKLVSKSMKGAFVGLIISIMSILVFAIIVKQFGLSDEAIAAINQAIKVVAIFVSAFLASKNTEDAKLAAGIVSGVIYVIFGFLVFSLIESQFGSVKQLLMDALMGAVVGLLTAMIFTKLFAAEDKKGKKK